MTLLDILQYYADLLICQYRGKSKASDTIKALVNNSACDGLVQTEQTCFDLDVAIGAQLDVLGRIVGVPRNVYGLDLGHTFFSFTRYIGSPASVGFGRYADQPDSDYFYRYNNYATYTLTDFEMRFLIKLKIIYNTKYSSFKYLKEAIYSAFGNDIDIAESAIGTDITRYTFFNFTRYSGTPASTGFGRYSDNPYRYYCYRYAYSHLMQLTYSVKSTYQTAFEAGVFLDIIPRPAGVKVNALYS